MLKDRSVCLSAASVNYSLPNFYSPPSTVASLLQRTVSRCHTNFEALPVSSPKQSLSIYYHFIFRGLCHHQPAREGKKAPLVFLTCSHYHGRVVFSPLHLRSFCVWLLGQQSAGDKVSSISFHFFLDYIEDEHLPLHLRQFSAFPFYST